MLSYMSQIDLNRLIENTTYNLLFKHTRLQPSNSWIRFQLWQLAKKRKSVTLHSESKKYQMCPILDRFKDQFTENQSLMSIKRPHYNYRTIEVFLKIKFALRTLHYFLLISMAKAFCKTTLLINFPLNLLTMEGAF